jgi:hypothetical protein
VFFFLCWSHRENGYKKLNLLCSKQYFKVFFLVRTIKERCIYFNIKGFVYCGSQNLYIYLSVFVGYSLFVVVVASIYANVTNYLYCWRIKGSDTVLKARQKKIYVMFFVKRFFFVFFYSCLIFFAAIIRKIIIDCQWI